MRRLACSHHGPFLSSGRSRVCQEAGARVALHVSLGDMNIDVPVLADSRIEVVANGLSLWHGSQQAVDATIVSPSRGQERPPGELSKEPLDSNATRPYQTYTVVRARRCRLVVVCLCCGGRLVWGGGCQLAPGARRATCFAHTCCHASGCGCSLGCPLVGPISCRCTACHRGISVGAPACRGASELHEVLADVRWQLPVLGSRQGPVLGRRQGPRYATLKPWQELPVGHGRCFVTSRGRKKA